MPEEEEGNARLRKGDNVNGCHGGYEILRLLGEGGFGAVYKVRASTDRKEHAMKVEFRSARDSKLKMEIAILKLVNEQADSRRQNHYTRIIDRGKNEQFQFVVMQLVGKSLDDLKANRHNKVFSPGTAFGVGLQCLEALEQLHKQAYIHRDIKPANYAKGLDNEARIIYLLDFGIARKFTNDTGDIKTPRSNVPFKGTVRFAAINCHRNVELGPKDDVESWFYLLCDILISTGLPWKKLHDRHDVLTAKVNARLPTNRHKWFFNSQKYSQLLSEMLDYTDNLSYVDHVDYKYIYKLIALSADSVGADMNAKFDFE